MSVQAQARTFVGSEVGVLRRVLLHRPDRELKRLTPRNKDDLLFDDVLWVERAQFEHDQFVARMRERDVEVFLFLDLLSEALAASDEGRRRLIEITASEYTVGVTLVEEVRATLWDMKPDQLATHLIGGLTVEESGLDLGRLHQIRKDARLARSNAEAVVERMLAEPASRASIAPRAAVGLLAALRRNALAALALMAGAERGLQEPVSGVAQLTSEIETSLAAIATALTSGDAPAPLPPLRRTQLALSPSAKAALGTETDLMVDSINTMAELLAWDVSHRSR